MHIIRYLKKKMKRRTKWFFSYRSVYVWLPIWIESLIEQQQQRRLSSEIQIPVNTNSCEFSFFCLELRKYRCKSNHHHHQFTIFVFLFVANNLIIVISVVSFIIIIIIIQSINQSIDRLLDSSIDWLQSSSSSASSLCKKFFFYFKLWIWVRINRKKNYSKYFIIPQRT